MYIKLLILKHNYYFINPFLKTKIIKNILYIFCHKQWLITIKINCFQTINHIVKQSIWEYWEKCFHEHFYSLRTFKFVKQMTTSHAIGNFQNQISENGMK